MILGSSGWVVVFRTMNDSGSVPESQKGSADLRRALPSIVLVQQVMVEEPLKVVVAFRLVDAVPLLSGVNAEPGNRLNEI